MIKRPLDNIKDIDIRETLQHLQEETTGRVLTLSAAPTAAIPLLDDNDWGINSDVLYHRVGAKIYAFTPSSTITIT